jgi:hypothetical protein
MRHVSWGGIAFFVLLAGEAAADEATVTVGGPRFSRPPPRHEPVMIVDPPPPLPPGDAPNVPYEAYRSPIRFSVGPAGVTTGRGLGLGLGAAVDFGRGTVGLRLAGAWLRGEGGGGDGADGATRSPVANGLGQYTGELTIDFQKRGPVHPVLGLGFGLARIHRADGPAGNVGIGVARLGVEYALDLEDADVRLGAGVSGALPGPADREVNDVGAYALSGAGLAVGF